MSRTPISQSIPITKFESINDMIRETNKVCKSVKLAMKSAQDRAKHYADKK